MKKIFALLFMATILVTSAFAVNLNERSKTADSVVYKGTSMGVTKATLNLILNDESGFKPSQVGHGTLIVIPSDTYNRFEIKLQNYQSYETNGDIIKIYFDSSRVKTSQKIKKMIKETFYVNMIVEVNVADNTAKVYSEDGRLVINNIHLIQRSCCTQSAGNKFCGDPSTDGYKIACGGMVFPPVVYPCTYTYSDWSSCVDHVQTRTMLTKNPSGCTENPAPKLTAGCGGVPHASPYI